MKRKANNCQPTTLSGAVRILNAEMNRGGYVYFDHPDGARWRLYKLRTRRVDGQQLLEGKRLDDGKWVSVSLAGLVRA